MKKRSFKNNGFSFSDLQDLNLGGCSWILGGLFVFFLLLMFSSAVQNIVINIFAVLVNTLILSNLFLFNIVVILVLLALIFLVLYIYSKL
ncbi:hypothetical protein KC678_03140 [Candidatus Dojkabacteria bacterium]|uniref:Uncharacterized protein n=1 Tax=Candidatus Dojkabacteria bacterium TaxID=2099670 RepID=A0A955IAD5_9BACT|nr:hypothetical protein [Candidatus Dojkabacteria bacterium]